jgi:predicted secreted protein
MTTKQLGKDLVVEWTPSGGSMVSIATKSRNFKVGQKGNSIDVSVREDILAGQKDKLADAPDRTAELSGLDTAVNAPDWEDVEIGDTGTLVWYRRGKSSGKPSRTATAVVTGSDFGSPHDNANDWSISWDITSAITTGTVA